LAARAPLSKLTTPSGSARGGTSETETGIEGNGDRLQHGGTFASLTLADENVNNVRRQEAQLSQRDRAMLRVIEYFAKSLEVTQGH